MKITIDDLTIDPEGLNSQTLLDEWSWLLPEPSSPVLITVMGDLFIQGESGSVYFLDAGEGKVTQVADDTTLFQAELAKQEFIVDHFFPGRVVELLEAGQKLEALEVYSYARPLVLGGEDSMENIEPLDVSVHLSLLGQIHDQVKDLPEGTVIDGIEFENE